MSATLFDDGYRVVPALLDPGWVTRLRQEAARFAASPRALSVEVQLVHRSSTIREFVTNGPQVAVAMEVLGPNVCFTHQQYIIKNPDPKARTDVPWHQDNGYGQLEPPHDLTVWSPSTIVTRTTAACGSFPHPTSAACCPTRRSTASWRQKPTTRVCPCP